jgi:hypothetical protein
VCLVERSSDPFSAIQGRPKIVAPMQGCPFGVAGSGWGSRGRLPSVILGCGDGYRTWGEYS